MNDISWTLMVMFRQAGELTLSKLSKTDVFIRKLKSQYLGLDVKNPNLMSRFSNSLEEILWDDIE